jgi:multiple sugar transport system permease protein
VCGLKKQSAFLSIRKAVRILSGKGFTIFLLVSFGFVFVFPIFYMICYSVMDSADLRSPLVNFIPTRIDASNYQAAAQVLNFWPSLLTSILTSVLPAACQSAAACVTAYGLARFKFPGRRLIFLLVVATFVIPPTITMLPQFLMYKRLGLIDTPMAFVLPALFGQGLRCAILILVFYQILSAIPRSLDEAALIDGAGPVKLFLRIGIPLSISGFVISFLFSLIWYWNETTLAAMYFGNVLTTLPMQLERFAMTFNRVFGARSAKGGKTLNQAVYMAGTMLNILPLIIIYFFTQKQFVQSVDRSGITGE